MKPVFAYLRVSGRGQIEGDGFPRQLDACNNFATLHDLEIVRVFREEGVCGATELENRPALNALYDALNKDGVTTVLIERLDRLARDVVIQETIINDFVRHGYEIISTCEDNLCSGDPSRTMMRQIFGVVAEYERKMIVLKLRGARQRTKAKTGRCEGQKPYGSLEGEKQRLDFILELKHSHDYDTDGIAKILNQQEVPSRSGKPWRGSVIRKILARERVSPNVT